MQKVDYSQMVAEERDKLFNAASKKYSKDEMERIREAYFFAEKAHAPQVRKSGEPYITHPIAVARIVNEELGLGVNPVIAALLHDVVEDTSYTLDDIQLHFGDDVAFLVDVVTKKNVSEFTTSKQVDNFRQMLDSIHYDIRALLVKLSDRLHNMRTLKSMKSEKQMKIAGETDYFYAPLANRLGLYKIKSELENLSMKYRSPHEYEEIEKLIDDYANEHAEAAEEWMEPIRKGLTDKGFNVKVTCDKRSAYSIWRKMQKNNLAFKEIEHIRVVHVIFEDRKNGFSEKNQALYIYSILTSICTEKPQSLNNYLDMPKDNGYRSLHCKLMGNEGRWMEVHIQSQEMQRISNYGCLVERETGVEHWICKFKDVLKDIAAQGRETLFIEDVVTTFYRDDIVVFTPKGECVTLPKDSTALDFAYEIHSGLGEKAKYAIINDRLCSVRTVLRRGDRVKIGTDENMSPKPEWLNFVRTYKANRSIGQYLRKVNLERESSPYLFCKDCYPLPGDEVVGFRLPNGKIMVHKCNCAKSISLSAQHGDVIENVDLSKIMGHTYPISLEIKGVDRDKFLLDLINEISNRLNLSIDQINSQTHDEIVICHIDIYVHSIEELKKIISDLKKMDNIYEVRLLNNHN